MMRVWILTLSLCFSSFAHSQVMQKNSPLRGGADDLAETDELEEEGELSSNKLADTEVAAKKARRVEAELDSELEPNTGEVLETKNSLLILGLGQMLPWTQVSLTWLGLRKMPYTVGPSLGGGNFALNGIQKRRSYDMTAKTKVLSFHGRYYTPWVPEVSFGGYFSLMDVSGAITPVASDNGLDDDEKLATDYKYQGVNLALAVQYTSVYKNNLVIDWTVFGAHQSWALKRQSTIDSQLVNDVVDKQFAEFNIHGIINVGVGYLF